MTRTQSLMSRDKIYQNKRKDRVCRGFYSNRKRHSNTEVNTEGFLSKKLHSPSSKDTVK